MPTQLSRAAAHAARLLYTGWARTRMIVSLAAVALPLALAACGGSTAAIPTPTPLPQVTATPAVLFQADWSHGLAGWGVSPGWSIVNGALQSDTGNARSVTVPYQPSQADYVVEVTLQVVSIPRDGGYYMLTADPSTSLSGYRAGIYSLRAPGETRPNGDHPTISTLINPEDDQDPTTIAGSVKDFEPASGAQIYRVVVQESSVQLYVDGRFFTSAASTRTSHLTTGPLHLVCGGVSVRITALRVLTA